MMSLKREEAVSPSRNAAKDMASCCMGEENSDAIVKNETISPADKVPATTPLPPYHRMTAESTLEARSAQLPAIIAALEVVTSSLARSLCLIEAPAMNLFLRPKFLIVAIARRFSIR